MAQAGGSNPDGMDKALTRFYEFVESLASSG